MAALLYKYVKNGKYTMDDIKNRFTHWYPQVVELWNADPEHKDNQIVIEAPKEQTDYVESILRGAFFIGN